MKNHFKQRGTGILALLCIFTIGACSSSYQEIEVTRKVRDSFPAFASDSDTAALRSITVAYADKRFYSRIEHSAIRVTCQVDISNKGSDTLAVRLSDSREYATYGQDTVGWLESWKIKDLNNFRVAPAHTESIFISNTGFFGGAFSLWEDLFPKTDDYTSHMLRILSDIKVYYNGTVVLPAKDIRVTVLNYKDDWLSRAVNRLTGAPYSYESCPR